MGQRHLVSFAFFGMLVGAYSVLAPGISGPLVLDDYPFFRHLPNDIESYDDFFKWVFLGGFELGRAPALASFLIDGVGFPPNTEAYKRTNLLIHLLNAVLVFYFVFLLAVVYLKNTKQKSENAVFIALGVMALWVVSPLLVSSVFMTIQRMTLLMSTFQLLGLVFYVLGRVKLGRSIKGGYAYITFGVVFFGVLATLTKENGILICVYILVLELTILRFVQWGDRYRVIWRSVFLWLPLILLALYMVYSVWWGHAYERRDFDLLDRVLWQPHIVLLYLGQLVAPRIGDMGPYHDGIQYSSDVLGSVLVLLPVVGVILLALIGFKLRKKNAVVSFAILWFLSGHILESTILPLELYFEHRNYLPSVSIFVLVVSILFYLYKKSKKISLSVFVAYLSLTSFLAFQQAEVWGNEELQGLVWARENPYSTRSSFQAMKYWIEIGDVDSLQEEYLKITTKRPGHLGMRVFGFLGDNCSRFNLNGVDSYQSLKSKFASAKHDYLAFNMMESLKKDIKEEKCLINFQQYRELIEAMLENDNYSQDRKGVRILYTHIADTFVFQGDLMSALGALERAYNAQNDYSLAISMSQLSLQLGNVQAAGYYFNVAKNTPYRHYYEVFWRNKEMNEWAALLKVVRTQYPGEENIWQTLKGQGRLPESAEFGE